MFDEEKQMVNGKPGDHPLNDIIVYNLEVYGKEADDLIRKIARLSSRGEVIEWWEKNLGWESAPPDILPKLRQHYASLVDRAKESGWEVPE